MFSSFITGLSGLTLGEDERRFIAQSRPCGLILFARNCESPAQIKALIEGFKAALGSDQIIISVDQEGGRVQRLGPPHWRVLPPADAYGRLWQRGSISAVDKTRLAAQLMALELTELGFNTNMVPVLDVLHPDCHEIISTRSYGDNPAPIIALGGAMARGHMAGGVLPVMKHIPGHGRATVDSHVALPVVDASLADLQRSDFAPFTALHELPAAMSAHVVYSQIDARAPASASAIMHDQIIRGTMGFDGLLMSDDLSMQALQGTMQERTRAVLDAGSDIALHCNGKLAEMRQVADAAPPLAGAALARFEAALAVTSQRQPVDICAAEAAIDESLSLTP